MSLFGGDEGRPISPRADSDFSISTIDENEHAPSSSYAAELDGTRDSDDNNDGDAQEDHSIEGDDLDEESVSEISDTDVRPNRYRGSDRAWLHHTQDDRAIAQSLDQIRANNLSLHLYSSHNLKTRLRNPALYDPARSWARKSRWVDSDKDGNRPWYPDPAWSAWPLEPDNVPTGNETFGAVDDGLDAFTIGDRTKPKLSHDLEQQLYAVMLARAHNMWNSRSPYSDIHVNSDHVPASARHANNRSRSLSVGRAMPAPSSSFDPDLPPLSSADQSVVSVHPGSADDTQATLIPLHDSLIKSEEVKPDHNEADSHVVFSADDNRSHNILHPTVRHVISKMDSLLLALHRSREAQTLRTRDGGDTSDSSARSNSRSRSRSSKTSHRQATYAPSRKSQRKTRSASGQEDMLPDQVMFDDSGEDETYRPTAKPQKRRPSVSSNESSPDPEISASSPSQARKPGGNHKFGQRDWSEVLGIASLSGWDTTAIERARQRCRDIFGEDMQLRTLPEHGDSSADEAEAADLTQPLQPPQVSEWQCPIHNCFRNIHPLSQGFRWREHMRTAHKYDKAQTARLEEQLVKSGAIALSNKRRTILSHNPRGWQPPDPLKCPHCPDAEIVYPKVNRLLDHFRRTHKYDPRIEDPPEEKESGPGAARDAGASSDSSSSTDTDSDDFMVGGVHNDGFLQPVLRHAGVRGEDLAQRVKRSNTRRTKLELRNAKKQRLHQESPPQLEEPDSMDTQ